MNAGSRAAGALGLLPREDERPTPPPQVGRLPTPRPRSARDKLAACRLGPPHKTRERRAATRCLLTGQTYGPGAPHFKQVRDKLSQGEDRLKGGTFRSAAFSRFPTNPKRKRRFCRENAVAAGEGKGI